MCGSLKIQRNQIIQPGLEKWAEIFDLEGNVSILDLKKNYINA